MISTPGQRPETQADTTREIESLSGWEKDHFLLASRRLLLFEDITDEMATEVIVAINRMIAISPTKPIYLYVNSDGGSTDAAFAIIDQMLMSPCPVYTIVMGRAYSSAAYIIAFGTKGKRFATANSSLMLHPMSFEAGRDHVETHGRAASFMNKEYDRLMATLAKQLGTKSAKLKSAISNGLWLIPKAAKAFGLIDDIWTPKMEHEVRLQLQDNASVKDHRLDAIGQILKHISRQIENQGEIEVEVE